MTWLTTYFSFIEISVSMLSLSLTANHTTTVNFFQLPFLPSQEVTVKKKKNPHVHRQIKVKRIPD